MSRYVSIVVVAYVLLAAARAAALTPRRLSFSAPLHDELHWSRAAVADDPQRAPCPYVARPVPLGDDAGEHVAA
eukprot:CAMPEP_0198313798 /NCGR_PEP_ID=MMETSP1450-20131203/4700_1 /TAXON_ID=753684 ORGANISM="Madagascaria erythrocladiodes, Strain CCMP3234" /NCGR_SAMPLE_ID=MMETSP1450 /ASSEMBLY_ACC=CAM_ASM_001115 /LENGTH=73 /DNA_ID=CAMNT_0044016817 /DNA_START=59 /DNA_END=277 /DNA_ORIENTATION=+